MSEQDQAGAAAPQDAADQAVRDQLAAQAQDIRQAQPVGGQDPAAVGAQLQESGAAADETDVDSLLKALQAQLAAQADQIKALQSAQAAAGQAARAHDHLSLAQLLHAHILHRAEAVQDGTLNRAAELSGQLVEAAGEDTPDAGKLQALAGALARHLDRVRTGADVSYPQQLAGEDLPEALAKL